MLLPSESVLISLMSSQIYNSRFQWIFVHNSWFVKDFMISFVDLRILLFHIGYFISSLKTNLFIRGH